MKPFSLRLLHWHAEAQIVPIWIGHREFPQLPGLINSRGVNWRLRSLRRVQTPRAKGHKPLIQRRPQTLG
jgi:hypothetical protein